MSKYIYIIDVREDEQNIKFRRFRKDANATSLEHVLGFVSVLIENGLFCSIQKIEIEDEEE